MPKRKSITSGCTALTASFIPILPDRTAPDAPASITCQILNLKLPICLTVMRTKTAMRIISEICVQKCLHDKYMRSSLLFFPGTE
jgi:hypothetical protein